MSFRQGHFLAQGISGEAMPEALLAAAAHAPRDVGHERFLLAEEDGWSAVLLLDGYGHVHRWAQAVSLERRVTTLSFFVLEGTWGYEIFDAGEHVLGMEWFPHERPLLRGDARAAARLLGCGEGIFARYHQAIVEACDDPEGLGSFAYDDDEFEAADEYAFADFAERVGLVGDIPFDGEPIGIVPPSPRSADWTGLGPIPAS